MEIVRDTEEEQIMDFKSKAHTYVSLSNEVFQLPIERRIILLNMLKEALLPEQLFDNKEPLNRS